jgi:hypothetical protein
MSSDIEIMMRGRGRQSQTQNLPVVTNYKTPSCHTCKKINMCWLWREVAKIERENMQTQDVNKIPIDFMRLAEICKEYEEKNHA